MPLVKRKIIFAAERDKNKLFLPAFDDGGENIQFRVVQGFQGFRDFRGLYGIFSLKCEKFLRRDAKIFTDIKEPHHRREIFPVFNIVDIACALSD
jgi:hypothetical protein